MSRALQTALQAQGESAWGITLVNTSQVVPGATVPGATCKNVFGPWCLGERVQHILLCTFLPSKGMHLGS